MKEFTEKGNVQLLMELSQRFATSGAGYAYRSGAPEFTTNF
jgi:hypothetical protein